jgi:hypothetical protein
MQDSYKNGKTFFVLTNNEVHTFHSIESRSKDILVFDRNSPDGVSYLDYSRVKETITEDTREYDERLKQFVGFLFIQLKGEYDLYRFACALWNKNNELVGSMMDEDIMLCERLQQFIDQLKNAPASIGVDYSTLLYFEEVYYNQEFVYQRYTVDQL